MAKTRSQKKRAASKANGVASKEARSTISSKATPKLKKNQKSRASSASVSATEDPDTEDEATEPTRPDLPKYKEDINAFNVPIEQDEDFISGMPSEILNHILSYVVADHDPDLAVKIHSSDPKLKENPHVLLSLAAMSRHFRDHVDDFCRREMTKHKDIYNFKTTAEIEESKPVRRRSERLKAKPEEDHRRYRFELVRHLKWHCVRCNMLLGRRAVMATGLACCRYCEIVVFPPTITLTEAKEKYDLRDWMLIPSRNSRLWAKHPELPTITYGTVRTGTPYYNGMTMSYRFFDKDVAEVAKAVHVNTVARLVPRSDERRQRKIKKRDIEHRKMKARYHEVKLACKHHEPCRKYHQESLDYYNSPTCDETYESAHDHIYGYHHDIHKRLCIKENCVQCEGEKSIKYASEFWKDMFTEIHHDEMADRGFVDEDGWMMSDDEYMWSD